MDGNESRTSPVRPIKEYLRRRPQPLILVCKAFPYRPTRTRLRRPGCVATLLSWGTCNLGNKLPILMYLTWKYGFPRHKTIIFVIVIEIFGRILGGRHGCTFWDFGLKFWTYFWLRLTIIRFTELYLKNGQIPRKRSIWGSSWIRNWINYTWGGYLSEKYIEFIIIYWPRFFTRASDAHTWTALNRFGWV